MWAQCTTRADCAATPTVEWCMKLNNSETGAQEGAFCTKEGCTDPVADCDSAPAGTPTCIPTTSDKVQGAVCAIACAPEGGARCPGGMRCFTAEAPPICG